MPASPAERSLAARAASHESWAHTPDRSARTAPGRSAFLDRFEKEVDPEGVLPPAERARRAEHAKKAYFSKLALKSARSRRIAREAVDSAELAEEQLREAGAR